MDVFQESVSEFIVGHGGADAASKPIITAPYSRKAYKGVNVRAATANTINIYVGPQGVSEETGYCLPAGEEINISVDTPCKVYVVASPAGNSQQVVTLGGLGGGDTFTLTFEGETTDAIASSATAATVKTDLEGLAGIAAGNVDVSGAAGGPYTVTFQGTFAKQDVSLMTGTATNGTVTITKTDASAGSQYSWISR
ncbi:MAG: hypothetical protein ACYC35_00535 [Pirellulales bacterium]